MQIALAYTTALYMAAASQQRGLYKTSDAPLLNRPIAYNNQASFTPALLPSRCAILTRFRLALRATTGPTCIRLSSKAINSLACRLQHQLQSPRRHNRKSGMRIIVPRLQCRRFSRCSHNVRGHLTLRVDVGRDGSCA